MYSLKPAASKINLMYLTSNLLPNCRFFIEMPAFFLFLTIFQKVTQYGMPILVMFVD